MPQKSGYRYNNFRKQPKTKELPVTETPEDEQNPVLKSFRCYARELDAKHDRYERIVKLSRDITIEAKRIIFLLHTIDGRKNNKESVLQEARLRLAKVIDFNFKAVAKELLNQDPYQYRNAFSPGLQEFIEAYSFMEYHTHSVNRDPISDWKMLQQKMSYEMPAVDNPPEVKETEKDIEITEEAPTIQLDSDAENMQLKFEFQVDPTEYILGVSDLTGELMRRCINSLGSGETDTCLDTCKALQHFYTGYVSLNVQRCRELSRKIYTMRQSLLKAENVCYNVKVRGSEAAKWGSVFENKPMDELDEGFY